MRFIAIAAMFLLLGCTDEKAARAKFLASCQAHEFTETQCDMLYSMKKNADDAADSNALLSGLAVGLAAGKR
jgi:hypothetical protein